MNSFDVVQFIQRTIKERKTIVLDVLENIAQRRYNAPKIIFRVALTPKLTGIAWGAPKLSFRAQK